MKHRIIVAFIHTPMQGRILILIEPQQENVKVLMKGDEKKAVLLRRVVKDS